MSNSELVIDYYTDILCVWAWIAQKRIEELNKHFGNKIRFRPLYVDIFGCTSKKMEAQWAAKGGFDGFGQHVVDSASAFEDAPVNQKIWCQVKPTTSANAHIMIKAVEDTYSQQTAIDLALSFRQAFFRDAIDISNLCILERLVKEQGLDFTPVRESIDNGHAISLLMHDYQQAKQFGIKGSPSYVLDGGRQTLFGNVGYRVLQANIEELLKKPESEASWC